MRVTYLEGQLEIMSPSRSHEMLKKLIARLLEAYAEEKASSSKATVLSPLDYETQTEAVRRLRAALRK